jgi:formylglycine-generating enzyme required for sulfatase activity
VWTLQFALTKELPFTAATENELMLQICRDEPRVAPGLPPPFDEIVRSCLIKDRRKRWTLNQVLSAIESVIPTAPMPEPPPRRRSPRLLLAVGGAAAVVAAAIGVGSQYMGPTAPRVVEDVILVGGSAAGEIRKNVVDGLEYVWIPPGPFRMGCSDGDRECASNERPVQDVTISRGFWMGRTEVTVEAYRRFSKASGRAMDTASNPSNGRLPVTRVS